MKKDRNCGCGNNSMYPTYPGMINQGMMIPNIPLPFPPTYGYNSNIMQGTSNNAVDMQLNQLQQQINNLERRITMLENNIQNNTTSFNSNYQML